jgi:hypothetical protein
LRQTRVIRDECEQKRSSGYLSTRVESAQCGNERIRQVLFSAGYPYLDLFDLRTANDVVLARKVDTGELTLDEARLQSAEMRSRVATEEQRRITATHQTQLQTQRNSELTKHAQLQLTATTESGCADGSATDYTGYVPTVRQHSSVSMTERANSSERVGYRGICSSLPG